ncbi:MAG: hypothetical protein V4530_12220 [Pseudomonadota bacterium]
MAKTLERFTITRTAEDFLILIEDDNGDTVELTATEDQLEMIGEELERAIEEEEAGALDDGDDDPDEEDE